jgi:hypothetical protein
VTDINFVYVVVGTRGFAADREFFVATWRRSREEAEEVVLRLKRETATLKEWDEEYRRLRPLPDTTLLQQWCTDYCAAIAIASEGYLYRPITITHDDPPNFAVHACDRSRVGTDGWLSTENFRSLEELS